MMQKDTHYLLHPVNSLAKPYIVPPPICVPVTLSNFLFPVTCIILDKTWLYELHSDVFPYEYHDDEEVQPLIC